MEYIPLIGRILFASFFLMSGVNHFTQREAMVQYAQSMGVPAAGLAVPLTGLMILVGGLSIALGYYPKIGAWLLVIFLIPTAFYMHRFWGLEDQMQAMNQMAHFMKNIVMTGAALLITYFGSGPFSLKP
jgi:putative oxidoreductase